MKNVSTEKTLKVNGSIGDNKIVPPIHQSLSFLSQITWLYELLLASSILRGVCSLILIEL